MNIVGGNRIELIGTSDRPLCLFFVLGLGRNNVQNAQLSLVSVLTKNKETESKKQEV